MIKGVLKGKFYKSMSTSWKLPEISEGVYLSGLKLNNSLNPGTYTEFIPKNKRQICWYMCGPTVYSDSHLGHAKTYLCFDTIRKIMTRHFKYDVTLIMNITNIDDKIINLSLKENKNFMEIANYWEADFFHILKSLDIDSPDILTRVTDYVPEIIDFIKKIISNGFAYESNGSVYFDTVAFSKDSKHTYPKLKPNASKSAKENPELTENEFLGEKRGACDFALWKKTKTDTEPGWESPWGRGRPGWHIECSAMCNSVTKEDTIDIHSGGDDLKFPHHDNELAQSEACLGCSQWVNYFIHSGRLDIKGEKMSKSLKNFTKIKDVLKNISPRVLRLFYSQTRYDNVLNYDPESNFQQAKDIDKRFTEFFKLLDYYLKIPVDSLMQQSQKMNTELKN